MEKLSLKYIVRKPKEQTKNTSLLILLHGYGSNEEDLYSFASELPSDLIIVSARALQDLGFGSYAWYTIHFNNTQGKFSDIPEAIKARYVIYKFIKEIQEKYTISPEKTFLLGFSQGTILSYAVALNHPETVQKVIALSGYVNPDLLPENMDKINWNSLSQNPAAIHLLEKNINKINWGFLSLNPEAIHLLEQNIDKISLLLNKNTDAFVEKINVCIPKTQEVSTNAIQEKLLSIKDSINMDIKTFLSSTNNSTTMADFIDKLDSKIVMMQQPIYTFLSSSQEQLTSKIDHLKEETKFNKTKNDELMTELGDFLNKYKSSSQFKGQCSENMVETILNKMYPTAEVINTTAMKASGDFILKRTGKPDIMIENKNYEANINIDETKKFIRDANEVKTHAIMMSQFSGIVSKPNGFIEINDGNVLIYLHNVDYSQDKIKMAIDIIDNLSVKLDEISNLEENTGHSISKECLERINDEYQKFQFQKETLTNTIKDMNKKMLSQVDEFKLPNLSMYLNDKFASIQNQQHICEFCNAPFQTKRSLASHKKMHKTK